MRMQKREVVNMYDTPLDIESMKEIYHHKFVNKQIFDIISNLHGDHIASIIVQFLQNKPYIKQYITSNQYNDQSI